MTTNNDNTKEQFSELNDYVECKYSDLEVGDSFRYTQQVFQKRERCCKYGIVFEIDDDDNQIIATCFRPREDFEPFKLDVNHKYKLLRFYKKDANSKYQAIDVEVVSVEEIEKLEEVYNSKFKILDVSNLSEGMEIYISNNKFKKLDREMKMCIYQYTQNGIYFVKKSINSARNIKIDPTCKFKKYMLYQEIPADD